jgi:hypothetical protein
MESYLDGFSSSALAARRGLTRVLVQAFGVYLTDRRLIVTEEESHMRLTWKMNPNAMFGTITDEVSPFLNRGPRTIKELEDSKKTLDVTLDQILSVELKPPNFFLKGHIKINLKSGESFKLLVLDTSEPFGRDAFEAAKELFLKHLPTLSRVE